MIKAIIFDFGNVICHFTNEIYKQKIADLSGKTIEEIKNIFYDLDEKEFTKIIKYSNSEINDVINEFKIQKENFKENLLKTIIY